MLVTCAKIPSGSRYEDRWEGKEHSLAGKCAYRQMHRLLPCFYKVKVSLLHVNRRLWRLLRETATESSNVDGTPK